METGETINNLCKKAIPVKKRAKFNSVVTRPASFELTLDTPQRGLGRLKQTMRSAAPLMHGTKPERSGSLDDRIKAKVAFGVLTLYGDTILPLILAISIVIIVVGIEGGSNGLGKLLPFVSSILKISLLPFGIAIAGNLRPGGVRTIRNNR